MTGDSSSCAACGSRIHGLRRRWPDPRQPALGSPPLPGRPRGYGCPAAWAARSPWLGGRCESDGCASWPRCAVLDCPVVGGQRWRRAAAVAPASSGLGARHARQQRARRARRADLGISPVSGAGSVSMPIALSRAKARPGRLVALSASGAPGAHRAAPRLAADAPAEHSTTARPRDQAEETSVQPVVIERTGSRRG